MPYVDNEGVRIHYRLEGTGPPLVLQHGWSGSIENWYDFGYVARLEDDYRLIAIDARGRGASDVPGDPAAYDTRRMAGDVLAVLDGEQIERAHYWGYSMGGWIGFDLARLAPQRFSSMILGGAHPYPESLAPLRDLAGDGTKAILETWDASSAPLSAVSRKYLAEHDLAPLLASCAQDRPDVSGVLPAMAMPCLVYAGQADDRHASAKRCAGQLPHGNFVSLPGLNHIDCYVRSDLVLPHVMRFLARHR